MKIYDLDNYHSLCVCGDIHGEFKTLVYNLKEKRISDSVIVVAGDCGVGFHKREFYTQLYRNIGRRLKERNNLILLVRGNHDDPEYFSNEMIDFPFLKTVPDYSILHFAGRNILCVGGGVSIDRIPRMNGMWLESLKGGAVRPTYWKDEAPVFDKSSFESLLANNISIDAIITHTAPSFCRPVTKEGIEKWLEYDTDLSKDLDMEREVMDRIHERLMKDEHPLKSWYYGHFHASVTEYISDIRFTMLDCMEIVEVM